MDEDKDNSTINQTIYLPYSATKVLWPFFPLRIHFTYKSHLTMSLEMSGYYVGGDYICVCLCVCICTCAHCQ